MTGRVGRTGMTGRTGRTIVSLTRDVVLNVFQCFLGLFLPFLSDLLPCKLIGLIYVLENPKSLIPFVLSGGFSIKMNCDSAHLRNFSSSNLLITIIKTLCFPGLMKFLYFLEYFLFSFISSSHRIFLIQLACV